MSINSGFYSLIVCVTLAGLADAAPSKVKQQFFPAKGAVRQVAQSPNGTVVVNAASYLAGVSPGGLATVFGTNLTDVTGIVVADTNPLPFVLANVSIRVNGIRAAIFSVAFANGEDQISFQVPWGTDTGQGAAVVQIFDYGDQVAEVRVDSFIEDPGIFEYPKFGLLYAVALHGRDSTLIGPDSPAFRGEVIILYTTGLGPVDQFVPDGFGAPFNPPANTIDPFQVVVAGEGAAVLFSGLAPGYVGLYQINLRLPDDLPAGDLTLRILSDFADSQSVFLPVR
jgi:minor extracellular serine protease Vpr